MEPSASTCVWILPTTIFSSDSVVVVVVAPKVDVAEALAHNSPYRFLVLVQMEEEI
jgi:hypothetical protein